MNMLIGRRGEGESYSQAISHAPTTRGEKDLCLIRIRGRCVKAVVRRRLLNIIESFPRFHDRGTKRTMYDIDGN